MDPVGIAGCNSFAPPNNTPFRSVPQRIRDDGLEGGEEGTGEGRVQATRSVEIGPGERAMNFIMQEPSAAAAVSP